MHACMHAYIHTYIHPCLHTYIYACMHTYIHRYIHTCMHACIHTYIHACIHTYIHTYVHTYIHTYTCLNMFGVHLICFFIGNVLDITILIHILYISIYIYIHTLRYDHEMREASRMVYVLCLTCLYSIFLECKSSGKFTVTMEWDTLD